MSNNTRNVIFAVLGTILLIAAGFGIRAWYRHSLQVSIEQQTGYHTVQVDCLIKADQVVCPAPK